MAKHSFTFIPCPYNTAKPVEAHCTCGVILPALSSTDAMRIARVHIEAENVKESSEAITQ